MASEIAPRPPASHPISRWLIISRWLPGYQGETVRGDALAGLSLAAFVIPESIAYATLAGLPPATGLYCYLVSGIAYVLFGTSKQLAVGPTSALALLIASSLMPLAGGDVARYAILAGATATLVGIISIAGRFVRIGYAQNFIGSVVLVGFKAGAALFIASTQIPKIFGVEGGAGNFFARIWGLSGQLPHAHLPSLFLGVGAITALLVLARIFPGRPTTIVVVAAVLILMHAGILSHFGIRTAGLIPNGLPAPSLALFALPLNDLQTIVPIALACFILAYVETIAVARSFAEAHGEVIDPDEELLALGVSNVATGAFHGFPVAGGMSQTAVNDLAGARSQLSLVATSLTIAITLLFFAGIFSAIPQPLLGAIVVVAATHLIHVGEIKKLWATSRSEFWVAIFAAGAVLVTGLLYGVMWAVVFSLLMILRRATRPEIAVLGELPGTTMYVNVAYNPKALVRPEILAVRVFGPWMYFNAGFIQQHVLKLVERSPTDLELVVLDFSASPSLDVQSIEMLEKMVELLEARGIRVRMARLYDEVARKFQRSALIKHAYRTHESIHDIVAGHLAA